MNNTTMIPGFYENCEIFFTGGSGMVGKAVIEKLLRSCNVKRIYMLLRPKKNMNVEQRLAKLCNAQIFNVLRSVKPNELNKLVAVPGDAGLPNLGISPDYAKIMANVSIIFHCAATVRFDEPLRVALKLNVFGTLEALKFAETLTNLKIFMHVSTFFSNPYLNYVGAKIHSSPMDWRICLKMLEDKENQDYFDFLTKKMITGFANTYTFTKNLAETIVNEYRDRLPVAIYKPSVVIFSLSEPEPGFPPGLFGAMGLFALVSIGILKTVYIGNDTHLDLTPQDAGVKFLLYYAVKAAEKYKLGTPENAPVYLTSSYKHSSHTFKQMGECTDKNYLWENGACMKSFLLPGCTYTSSRFYYMFLVFTKQIFPALLADGLLKLFGRKPVLMGIVRKAFTSLEVMQPFMFNNYASDGITDIEMYLEETKGTEFTVTPDINYVGSSEGLVRLCMAMVYGIRKVLLKESPDTLPKARKILRIKKYIYNVIRAILAYYILRWFYRVLCEYVNTNFA